MRHIRSSDKALVDRLLAGEEEAYRELFAVQVPRLFRIALARVSGDEDAAEDVVQATLLKAMPKLATYRGEASLLTWLGTFCIREAGAYHRRRQRTPGRQLLAEDTPEVAAALELLEAVGDGPEQAALKGEVARLVQATLDRLPPRYGDVLEWKYHEGLSVKEIAAKLETGTTAVQSLLARARTAFREGFAGVGASAGVVRFSVIGKQA